MYHLRNAAVLSWQGFSSHLSKVLGGSVFFSFFLISQARLPSRSLHLLPATYHELRASQVRTTSAQRMSSSDENEFEAHVNMETYRVPSPPPLPPLIEEERDRSGSSASSSSSSSSSSAASSCAPASSHSEDTRREEVEVHVVQEVVTRNEWQREEERVEVVSIETTWETRSAEGLVDHMDGGRTSRRSSSSSSSSASSSKGRVVERRELADGPQVTLFVKVGNTGLKTEEQTACILEVVAH